MQVGPDLILGRVLGEVHVDLGDHYIFDLDDQDLLEVTGGQDGCGREAYESEHVEPLTHQNRTSRPKVGSRGNIDTPDLTGGLC